MQFTVNRCWAYLLLMLLESGCAVLGAAFLFYTRHVPREAWSSWRRDVTSSYAARLHSERGAGHGCHSNYRGNKYFFTHLTHKLIYDKGGVIMKDDIKQREKQASRQRYEGQARDRTYRDTGRMPAWKWWGMMKHFVPFPPWIGHMHVIYIYSLWMKYRRIK